jgi:hypothetical protein
MPISLPTGGFMRPSSRAFVFSVEHGPSCGGLKLNHWVRTALGIPKLYGDDTMFKIFAGIGTIGLTIAITLGIASAQTDGPQPSRNDPPPSAPNESGKDPVPPATDPCCGSTVGEMRNLIAEFF